MPPRDTCFYDGRCSYCVRTTRLLRRLDWLGRLELRDLTSTPESELPVAIEEAMRGMPMRTADGRVLVGYPAVRRALGRTPLGFAPALLMHLPGVSWVGARVYGFVAANRPRRACAIDSGNDGGGGAGGGAPAPGTLPPMAPEPNASNPQSPERERVILFVCTGNTCRSPMGEAIARGLLARRGESGEGFRVISAGVSAAPGSPAAAEAVEAVRELGFDLGEHRSTPLTPELIAGAEIVYCMTPAHARAARALAPASESKIVPLDPEGDVPDPIGMGMDVYRQIAERLMDLIRARLEELES